MRTDSFGKALHTSGRVVVGHDEAFYSMFHSIVSLVTTVIPPASFKMTLPHEYAICPRSIDTRVPQGGMHHAHISGRVKFSILA